MRRVLRTVLYCTPSSPDSSSWQNGTAFPPQPSAAAPCQWQRRQHNRVVRHSPHAPPATMEDVIPSIACADVSACQYSAWRALFRKSPRCLPRSVVIPLPPAFICYLHQDGVVMPQVPPGVTITPADPRFEPPSSGTPVSWASSAGSGGESAADSSDDEGGAALEVCVRVRCVPALCHLAYPACSVWPVPAPCLWVCLGSASVLCWCGVPLRAATCSAARCRCKASSSW